MLGTRHNVPDSVCDSRVIQVIGRETNQDGLRQKMRGTGDTIYWCQEVRDGKARGNSFAVGSDELAKWEEVK